MKPSHRNVLYGLALIILVPQGCGPAHDRQAVYTAPRESRVRDDPRVRVQARAPSKKLQVPATKPEPPSNGIDVPIIEPE